VDTRTDVYSLGVLLYELLIGALPFDPKELRKAGFDEIRRRIREEEPSKPSARISSLGDASTDSARRRRTDPTSLARRLRGDLDWITMKALEKDRTRRYGSPQDLAADIGRYLTDQPVLASPPSAAYRAKKFVRRHRLGVAFAATMAGFLIGFGIWMSVLYRQSETNLKRALQAEAKSTKEAETAKQALDFMTGLFEISDPSEARGNNITAREILDKGATKINDTLTDQPGVQARLMGTMGNVYRKLGLYEQAEPLLEQALATTKDQLGDDHPDTLTSMNNLAKLYLAQARYDEAEPLYLEALETRKRVLGDDHPDTLLSMNNLASLYHAQARYDEAQVLYLKTLEGRKRVLGDDHPDTLLSMNNLANVYKRQGRYDEAEPLYLKTLEGRKRVLGDDHPNTLKSMNRLAYFLLTREPIDSRDPRTALSLAVEVAEKTGYENPYYLDTLSLAYHLTGDIAKAIENQKKAISLLPEEDSARRASYGATLAKFEAALEADSN
jgi:non-specific serine/threonine protein kinase/serine/threonine-protein kinase